MYGWQRIYAPFLSDLQMRGGGPVSKIPPDDGGESQQPPRKGLASSHAGTCT